MMITVLFGEITTGRITRLRYFGWSLVLGLLGIAIAFGVGAATGVTEHMTGSDALPVQGDRPPRFGIMSLVVVVISLATLFAVSLNLMAKRIRDMGLPAWWSVLVIVLLGGSISVFFSEQWASGFQFLVWLALLLVPTAAFHGKETG